MVKKQDKPLMHIPVEKLAYCQQFYASHDTKHQTWTLCDYSEQSITGDGALCPNKPIKVRNDTGIKREIPWGTMVIPLKLPPTTEPTEEPE